MKKSLKSKILSLLYGFVIVMNFVAIFMSYRNFVDSTEQFSYSTANTVAETCLLILDVDKLSAYIQTGQRDTSYYEMWNKLIDYRNTNKDIVNLSVVWFDKVGSHYIFDTNLDETGAFLGDYKDFDHNQEKIEEDLVQGKEIGFITYPDRMDVYNPVLSSYNIPIGYVIVGISTVEAEKSQYVYLFNLITIMLVLTFAATYFFIRKLTSSVIRPINQLSEAASNYVNTLDKTTKESSLSHLNIETGDEVEQLFTSIKKMESDLLNVSDSLAIATWNSQHDSMTQLYNKRYLKECIKDMKADAKVGIIYFDVDNLKKMNDICGHESGDKVIKKTAEFIMKHQPKGAFSFRVGGDEFLMIINDWNEAEIKELAEKMKADPDKQLTEPDQEVCCRIAIGCAYGLGRDAEAVIEEADQNMYLDKQSHR